MEFQKLINYEKMCFQLWVVMSHTVPLIGIMDELYAYLFTSHKDQTAEGEQHLSWKEDIDTVLHHHIKLHFQKTVKRESPFVVDPILEHFSFGAPSKHYKIMKNP